MTESKKLELNKEDITKVAKGLGLAVAGAGVTYLLEVIPNINFGEWTPLVVAVNSVLANFVRKWLSGKK